MSDQYEIKTSESVKKHFMGELIKVIVLSDKNSKYRRLRKGNGQDIVSSWEERDRKRYAV